MFFLKGKPFLVPYYFLSSCILILHGKTLSVEELKAMCGFKMSASKNSTRNPSMLALTGARFMACESVSCLPPSYSYLDHKDVCPSLERVTSQLKCGSCWAIAAAAVISDRHCLRTGEQRMFSAKHIAGCAASDGCYGGDPKDAMEYYVKQGVVTGGDPTVSGQGTNCVPYVVEKNHHLSCETTCESDYSVPFESDKRKGLSSYVITSRSVNEIKLDLMSFGPLVATMEIFDDFGNYKKGIYEHSPDSKLIGTHAVRLVGWGEENGIPFWICANSFGENWGDNGFFRILAGRNECQIESYLIGVETQLEIPMEARVTSTTKSTPGDPMNSAPLSSSIPIAVCVTGGNTRISGALIRFNLGNVIGDFNTICINYIESLTDTISGRNNTICDHLNGTVNLLANQYCNTFEPLMFNCDNIGYNDCTACFVEDNFKHCADSLPDSAATFMLKQLPIKCKSSLNTHDAIIKINDDVLSGSGNLICHNKGSIVGNFNVICRNDGTINVASHDNQICDTKENLSKSIECQQVERFCQICDSHLVFKEC